MSAPRLTSSAIDRRRFLEYVWWGAGSAMAMALLPGGALKAAPALRQQSVHARRGLRRSDRVGHRAVDPAGTGSGRPDVARPGEDPGAAGGSLATTRCDTSWRRARRRRRQTSPTRCMSRSTGLRSGADYFFQFDSGGEESAVGHFRTAPGATTGRTSSRSPSPPARTVPSGYYTAYRDMVQNDLDLVLHLGDYTYEYGIDPALPESAGDRAVHGGGGRPAHVPAPPHAAQARSRTSRRPTPRFPFVVVWDDHEVQNDYSGLAPEWGSPSPEFTARRAAAYQAFYEHLPIRLSRARRPRTSCGSTGVCNYGRLAEFTMFDDRQYRTDNPCGDGESLRCEAALSDDYTMLGRRQERWVKDGLDDSRARWSIVGQQLLLAELEHLPYEDERYWNDAWDGYPMARQRLLETVVDEHVRNPVFFTGDWHSTFVNDLKLDFKDPAAPTVATEFVTPAITTGGDGTPYGPYYGPMVPYNPHIKYYEGDRRGYMKATVTKQQLQVDLRFVTSVEDPAGTGYTERTFYVEDRVPGAVV